MFRFKHVEIVEDELLVFQNVDTGEVVRVPVSVLFLLLKSFNVDSEVISDDVQKSS